MIFSELSRFETKI